MNWNDFFLIYLIFGFIVTELAVYSSSKKGLVTPLTHPLRVRVMAYIIYLLFWPIFVYSCLKKD